VLRANAAVEAAGIPSVAIVSQAFLGMAKVLRKTLGVEGLPLAVYPGVIPADPDDVFDEKVRETVLPEILAGLVALDDGDAAASAAQDAAMDGEPSPRDIVFRGDLDEVLDHFRDRIWTDGLPIVPPTIPRVERFLRHTARDPLEVLGVAPPAYREVTVWNVAVNGVMAGCAPEHLPVLIAIAEALLDPVFRLEDAGSTPGWEPLVTVSGPRLGELGFHSGAGVLRVGNRANTSIGRFTRLLMRNVGGLVGPPHGEVDQAAIGATFNVVLAEDESATRGVGWPSLRADHGYSPDDTMVMVRSVFVPSAPIYSGGPPEEHLNTIAQIFGDALGAWNYQAYAYGSWKHLLVIGPEIAAVLARAGLTKDDVRQYLYDNMWADADWLARYAPQVSSKQFSWTDLVDAGKAPKEYAAADTVPGMRVRRLLRPEWTDIVVAGSPGRNQSRAYVSNHNQGMPATRLVDRTLRSDS